MAAAQVRLVEMWKIQGGGQRVDSGPSSSPDVMIFITVVVIVVVTVIVAVIAIVATPLCSSLLQVESRRVVG